MTFTPVDTFFLRSFSRRRQQLCCEISDATSSFSSRRRRRRGLTDGRPPCMAWCGVVWCGVAWRGDVVGRYGQVDAHLDQCAASTRPAADSIQTRTRVVCRPRLKKLHSAPPARYGASTHSRQRDVVLISLRDGHKLFILSFNLTKFPTKNSN